MLCFATVPGSYFRHLTYLRSFRYFIIVQIPLDSWVDNHRSVSHLPGSWTLHSCWIYFGKNPSRKIIPSPEGTNENPYLNLIARSMRIADGLDLRYARRMRKWEVWCIIRDYCWCLGYFTKRGRADAYRAGTIINLFRILMQQDLRSWKTTATDELSCISNQRALLCHFQLLPTISCRRRIRPRILIDQFIWLRNKKFREA